MMQIHHFNNYLSIIFAISFAYAFVKKEFLEVISRYFGNRIINYFNNIYNSLLGKLAGYQENIAQYGTVKNTTKKYQLDYEDLKSKYDILYSRIISKDVINNLNSPKNFFTKHLNVLSFLAGIFCLLLIFLGSMIQYKTDLIVGSNIYYRALFVGIQWLLIILLLFLFDFHAVKFIANWIINIICKSFFHIFKRDKLYKKIYLPIEIGYVWMLLFIIWAILNMHFDIFIDQYSKYSINHNSIILFIMLLVSLHLILYISRGLITVSFQLLKIIYNVCVLKYALNKFAKKNLRDFEMFLGWNGNDDLIPIY
jgi:hypothetical protein